MRDLEHDSGYLVRFQTFQELSSHAPKQFPKDIKTVVGMANALRVTPAVVVLAYAESLGVPVEIPSTFASRLPANIDDVDIDMQNALIAVARAAARPSGSRGVAVLNEAQDDSIASLIGSATEDAGEFGLDKSKKRDQG